MNDGIVLTLNADLEKFTKDYEEALRKDGLLEVENGSGHMRIINPRQILYFEDASQPASEEGWDGSSPAESPTDVPARQ
jgi:hypothetical protein